MNILFQFYELWFMCQAIFLISCKILLVCPTSVLPVQFRTCMLSRVQVSKVCCFDSGQFHTWAAQGKMPPQCYPLLNSRHNEMVHQAPSSSGSPQYPAGRKGVAVSFVVCPLSRVGIVKRVHFCRATLIPVFWLERIGFLGNFVSVPIGVSGTQADYI